MPDNVSALQLLLTADPTLLAIIRLSLLVSFAAVILGGLIGVPLGAGVALTRFAGREDRKRNRFELTREIETALVAKSAPQWAAVLNQHGVPAGEVLDVPAVLEHAQIKERQLLRTFEQVSDVDRPVSVVRAGFRLASGDPGPAMPPPALGADTADILGELGFSQREIDQLACEKVI